MCRERDKSDTRRLHNNNNNKKLHESSGWKSKTPLTKFKTENLAKAKWTNSATLPICDRCIMPPNFLI